MAVQAQMHSDRMDNALCFISQEQQLMQRVQPEQPIELDAYINFQNERLRLALQEQRRRQVESLMKRCESKVRFLIGQKEREIERASRRSAELREFLKRMEVERHAWQAAARENESIAASLTQRLREAAADDAESRCCLDDGDARMTCKRCGRRESCVIVLPCRHLCSCRECDALLHSCPVCNTIKKASIEAFF